MTTLHLVCGLPGSGKTTFAKELEQETKALRLCPDEWISALLKDPDDRLELDRLRDPVEALQWDLAKKLLVSGLSVILENGFWSQNERLKVRSEAEQLGAKVKLHFLELEFEALWQRIAKRNAQLPEATFVVSKDDLALWYSKFEAPSLAELALNE